MVLRANALTVAFTVQSLLSHLPPISKTNQYWIAYSGGVDSHVLLHAVHEFTLGSAKISAIHINHGLSPNADYWQTHCQTTCDNLKIPLIIKRVELNPLASSIENQARNARYHEFSKILNEGDCLLMAHHQNDQVETVLFRLLRGSGPRGLAAIPAHRSLAKGQIIRPLLSFSQSALIAYAEANQLKWIEDESNQEMLFDRNFLRLKVFPLLQQRWPNFANNWQRSAQLCHDADQLQTVLGEQDLNQVQGAAPNRLNLLSLKTFSQLRQRNILRVWFDQLHRLYQFPLPGFQLIQQILSEVVNAGVDANPLVSWYTVSQQVNVRRYANVLYVLQPIIFQAPIEPFILSTESPLKLSESLGSLSLVPVKHHGFDLKEIKQVQICFRQGGEKTKPSGRRTQSLKKIFQDYAVPPWLRDNVPLIYFKGELIAVADLFVAENYLKNEGKNLYRICWLRPDIHCGF